MRVRIGDSGAYLNLKSKQLGVQRLEFEYPVPREQAEQLIANFAEGSAILKTRHYVPSAHAGMCFEIDEFAGDNAGLIVAELELPAPDFVFVRPAWLGVEVTEDARYYNSNLVARPFSSWGVLWD